MANRFDYVKYDEKAMETQSAFKNMMINMENMVEGLLPKGRAQSLVLTKLEEAYMWIGKAIRDEQVEKRKAELEEGRTNS